MQLERNLGINDDANLGFLKPSQEQIYEHKAKNPYVVEDICIRVDLPKKMGSFYIDLQG